LVKRYLVIFVVVLGLVVPASAIAAIRHFHGPIHPSGNVDFHAKIRHGHVRKVVPGFAFNHVPMQCNEGHKTISGSFNFSMKVHHHHFSGSGTFGGGAGTVAVTGEFKHHGRKAEGTINAHGTFSPTTGTIHACHSGTLDWDAHKV
jgi:hypothetical protein